VTTKLTDKQSAFVAEYPTDKNATQAAIRAGYSTKTARSQGQRLLTKVDIKDLVNQKLTELEEKAGLTAELAMREVKAIATSNIMDGMDYDADTGEIRLKSPDQIPEEFWKACSELTTYQLPDGGGLAMKVKMVPKLPALKMEYDRHKLIGNDGNVNNFAIGHVSQLQLNAAKRRAGMKIEDE
jgi:phage terminase small subunit